MLVSQLNITFNFNTMFENEKISATAETSMPNEEEYHLASECKSLKRLFGTTCILLFLLLISFSIASHYQWKQRVREFNFIAQVQSEIDRSSLEYDAIYTKISQKASSTPILISTTTKKITDNKPSGSIASWYDYKLPDFPDYSKNNFTAASRDYPKGTILIVCQDTIKPELKCVQVRVNDYGPDKIKHPDRAIDLSSAAFKELAPLSVGLVKVKIYTQIFVIQNREEEKVKAQDQVFIKPIHKEVN